MCIVSEKIDDNYIINRLWPKKICLLNRCKDRITPEIENYLLNRYNYTESIEESLYCIKFNIDRDNMICPICHKGILKFRKGYHNNPNVGRGPFLKGCTKECQLKYRNLESIETSMKLYGTKYPAQNKEKNKEISEKRKKTNLSKYGVEFANQSEIVKEKTKQTCLKKYGVEYSFQSEQIKNHIKESCIKHFGVTCSAKSDVVKEKYKQTCLEKYGVTNVFARPDVIESIRQRKDEIQRKRDETKRKNNTFHTSKPEEKTYEILKEIFGKDDIERNYNKSFYYPFKCDFYIKSKDLYIECNYHWTHFGHFYNKESKEDNNKLNELKKKQENSSKNGYLKGAIKTWTERDPLKLEYAKKFNLNYLVFWNINEFNKWIDENYRRKI